MGSDITVLYIKDLHGGVVPIVTDGDYDGEWFQDLVPYMRVIDSGYVQLHTNTAKKFNLPGYLHHLVLRPKKDYWVTFKNGDKRDHRSENLEYKTPSQVARIREANFKGSKHQIPRAHNPNAASTTPYRGVRFDSRVESEDVYYAMAQGIYLGQFGTPEAAARAYDAHAREAWGDRAILNFPEEE